MNNEIKQKVEKIEIPEELHTRTELKIKQVKQNRTKKIISYINYQICCFIDCWSIIFRWGFLFS